MNKLIRAALCVCVMSLLHQPRSFAQSATSDHVARCKRPIILELVPSGKDLEYRLDGKSFDLYPLTPIADELSGCKVERTIFVIVDHHLSAGDLISAVPSKLQADSVRYFVRTDLSLVEVKIVSYDAKIPTAQ
jgi:hypothetical protein